MGQAEWQKHWKKTINVIDLSKAALTVGNMFQPVETIPTAAGDVEDTDDQVRGRLTV